MPSRCKKTSDEAVLRNLESKIRQSYRILNLATESEVESSEILPIYTHYIHLQHDYTHQKSPYRHYEILRRKDNDHTNAPILEDAPLVQYSLFPELHKVPFPTKDKHQFTFIDLFAGIGGFRLAMQRLGGKCVYSSEFDKAAQVTYLTNYGDVPYGDITTSYTKSFIPDNFDLLCAGFPCQAFSKAGKQNGWNDTRGTLFFEVEQILREKKPKYLFLENVRNIVTHDHGNTWRIIQENLRNLGYRLTAEPLILSPHQFGVPQFRERVYILGVLDQKNVDKPLSIDLGPQLNKNDNNIDAILERGKVDKKYYISKQEESVLNAWDEFYHGIKETTLGFPVWADYFVCDTAKMAQFPGWKQDFIKKNMALYDNNKTFINQWLKKWHHLQEFTPTQKKFEWQAGGNISSIWEGVIQFRPSGIRVKKPNFFPALVAMVQIPIIGKYRRRLTIRECARLQSFPDEFIPNATSQLALKQLGNSVNTNIVEFLGKQLIKL